EITCSCFHSFIDKDLINLVIPDVWRIILEVHGECPEGNMKQLKTMKVNESKLEDIPVVREFPGVFAEDLLGLPQSHEVEFHTDLIPRAIRRNKVIAYASRKLKIHEKNYTTHDLELAQWKEWIKPRRARAMSMKIQSSIKARILEAYIEASKGANTPAEMLKGLDKQFERKEDGRLYVAERIWVPVYGNLRTLIMNEAHTSKYSIHPGADKMYYDLRDLYWWLRMKKDIALYVSKCLTCSKVKAEHQTPSGLIQQPEIPEWKWENITMEFVENLPRTSSGHDVIWVIVDRLTKSAHFLAIHEDYKMERLARPYINKIITRHGVPVLIISDRDSHFTSRFWQSL
nr:putative reverse transcriptase domain-containing protein [Tanacetum cinerariifolium]